MEFNEIERDDDFAPRQLTANLTDATKAHNMSYLNKSGLKFTSEDNGDTLFFNARGKPTVTFYPRRSRWKVRGKTKTTHGSVGEFVTWLKGFHGLESAPIAQAA